MRKLVVALKVLSKKQILKHRMEQQICREIELQSKLRHPNIIKLYNYFYDERRIYLILEYAPTDMFELLKEAKRFSEQQAANYLLQVANGVQYLHDNQILHRDIKPENLMVVNDTVKIADFGWSVKCEGGKRKTVCGTVEYLSPEIAGNTPYDYDADVWALGVLLYEFLIGKSPFQGGRNEGVIYRIKRSRVRFPSHLQISKGAQDLICGILQKDKEDRYTLDEILHHPWLLQMTN